MYGTCVMCQNWRQRNHTCFCVIITYLFSLCRKQQALLHSGVQVAPLPPPAPPLAGWEVVTDSNVDTVSASIPTVTSGKLYIRPL